MLTLLVFQNAASAILTRWTRVKVEGVPMYFDSSAVLCTELLKVPMCAAMMLYTLGARGAWRDTREGFSKPLDVLKLAVPAMCYTLQNILFYVSLTNLSASTYQVLSQLKTLATAGFWVTMLGGRLAARQWGALGTLIAGVSVVQLDSVGSSSPLHVGNQLVGVSAVLGSSVLSGFANVYFEKLVKTTPTSIWVRNLQLAAFTVPQSLLFMAKDSAGIGRSGVLHGFTLAVWGVIALKALGGLVVASTVKFADSLLKSFATAISIIVTCLIAVRAPRVRERAGGLRRWPPAHRSDPPRARTDPSVRHGAVGAVRAGRGARDRLCVHVQRQAQQEARAQARGRAAAAARWPGRCAGQLIAGDACASLGVRRAARPADGHASLRPGGLARRPAGGTGIRRTNISPFGSRPSSTSGSAGASGPQGNGQRHAHYAPTRSPLANDGLTLRSDDDDNE